MADNNLETITVETAHVLWFLETGQHIDDATELGEAWAHDCPKYVRMSTHLISALKDRGIRVEFRDISKSHFAK